ncbi:hypothetical protein pb186bvf_013319 [Paramecium bursaria]
MLILQLSHFGKLFEQISFLIQKIKILMEDKLQIILKFSLLKELIPFCLQSLNNDQALIGFQNGSLMLVDFNQELVLKSVHYNEDIIEAILTTPKHILTISQDNSEIKIYDYNFKMICKQEIRISARKNILFKGDLVYFTDRAHNIQILKLERDKLIPFFKIPNYESCKDLIDMGYGLVACQRKSIITFRSNKIYSHHYFNHCSYIMDIVKLGPGIIAQLIYFQAMRIFTRNHKQVRKLENISFTTIAASVSQNKLYTTQSDNKLYVRDFMSTNILSQHEFNCTGFIDIFFGTPIKKNKQTISYPYLFDDKGTIFRL